MSKFTRPETEASLTCGFYNNDPGYEHPRRYDAVQMSKIFDGVINDGVFKTIGTCFVVKAGSGNTVNVGVGKAWFNHTWTENDAILPVTCEDAELLLDRIDAVVIDIDASQAVADNVINVIKGTPASKPVRPTLIDENSRHQHALCYIYRKAESTQITDADITNVVGTDETPFITGILETTSREDWFAQWRSELDQFVDDEETRFTTEIGDFVDTNEADFNAWYDEMKRHMEDVVTEMEDFVTETETWSDNQKTTILEWFDEIKGQLSTDAAANLQIQIDENEIIDILMNGFVDGTKTFNEDGTISTATDSKGRKLVKTFTNEFLTSTTVLYNVYNVELGRLVKNVSSDGMEISSEVTII